MVKIKVEVENIIRLLKERDIKDYEFSIMMGYGRTWFADMKRRKEVRVIKSQLEQMALILNCNTEDIVKSETPETDTDTLGMSEFELQVLDMLKSIKQKVDSSYQIAMMFFNEKQKEPEKPKQDELTVATKTLKELLENKAGIKYDEYMKETKSRGITNDKVADAAILKAGYKKKTMGYGNNKTLWIYKEVNIS